MISETGYAFNRYSLGEEYKLRKPFTNIPHKFAESTAMHLEPYNGNHSYMAGSSATTSCLQLFGDSGGGGAAPPSPSASDHMVSSPAANLLTPSASSGGGGNIFQFPPPQPPILVAGKDPGWEGMTQTQQHSPMAISPSFSTLNTPRGSITSTRSHHSHSSHSPMGMIVDGANMVHGGQQSAAEQAYHLGK